ncbi:MAG: DUF3109 family protein [Bacteroidaceae bacterium]|nr:DUF3109 family protein [Bacteroidaceae bacterium]
MVQVGEAIVSFDMLKEPFCCDLSCCKGVCCIEGDAGAPVTIDEVAAIENLLPEIEQHLSPEAKDVISKQGVAYTDASGDLVTNIVNGKDCVFTCYGSDGCCYCAIERAFREGRTSFMKPLSCHLYPIRISKVGSYKALNYNRWDICKAAVIKGKREDIPVYKFLKEPLIRCFGEEWYNELETVVEELKKQNYI